MKQKSKNALEEVMKKTHLSSFEDWVKNFAVNLPDIWNESSANDLKKITNKNGKKIAIVIGGGPSVKKHNHLELLKNSNFKGAIIVVDRMLKTVLEAGVTPKKFPKFFVISIEPYERIKKHYNSKIVQKFGSNIKAIFPVIISPKVANKARDSKIEIHWLHSLIDFQEGEKSFNKLSSIMIQAKSHQKGLPGIQTGGNVGTSAWFVSWRILKCTTVCMIGINHGWEEDDPWDKIISHGHEDPTKKMDGKNKNVKKSLKKVYNPDFDCTCILDPIYQFYSSALIEFISRSPLSINTINATEGGSIFGKRITSMTFKKFLEKFDAK